MNVYRTPATLPKNERKPEPKWTMWDELWSLIYGFTTPAWFLRFPLYMVAFMFGNIFCQYMGWPYFILVAPR